MAPDCSMRPRQARTFGTTENPFVGGSLREGADTCHRLECSGPACETLGLVISVPPPDVPVITRPPVVEPHAGGLLIATPSVSEDPWRRCVIALLEHGAQGSFGLILNKPLDPGFPAPDWAQGALRRLYGGPVEPDRGLALRIAESPAGAEPGDQPVTVEVLDMSEPALADSSVPWLFFAGQAGWMAGQLAAEIARGDWIVMPDRLGQALVSEPEGMWRLMLRGAGQPMRIWATMPEEPFRN